MRPERQSPQTIARKSPLSVARFSTSPEIVDPATPSQWTKCRCGAPVCAPVERLVIWGRSGRRVT